MADGIEAKERGNFVIGSQNVSEPESDREETGVHQLMDLHPDLAMAAKHELTIPGEKDYNKRF